MTQLRLPPGARNIRGPVEFPKWVTVGGKEVLALNAEHEAELLTTNKPSDNKPVTSCVTVAADTAPASAPSPKAAKLSKGAQTALRALQKAIGEVGVTPPASNSVPTGARAVTLDQWRDYAYRLGISGSSEARARQIAFQRAHEALIAAKQVGECHPWTWIV